jgi:antitoxin (DNA-binding transcriptional repressor) of toxin-antitoxin stability system
MTTMADTSMHGGAYGDLYTPAVAKRRIMGAQEVRGNFSDRLDAAEKSGEHTIVFRRSAPSAVLVPARWYHQAAEAIGDPWDDWVPPAEDDSATAAD